MLKNDRRITLKRLIDSGEGLFWLGGRRCKVGPESGNRKGWRLCTSLSTGNRQHYHINTLVLPDSVVDHEGDLRIWHIPNMPREPYRQKVRSVEEAKRLLDLLAAYDLFLGDLVETNAQGLEIFHDGEWQEWGRWGRS